MNKDTISFIENLKDKKIAFVGLGVANIPSAIWLASKGLKIYACDINNREYIGEDNCNELEKQGAVLCLGTTYLDNIDKMDIIFRSNGILPLQNPWIDQCINRGQFVTTESEIFIKLCNSKIIAITGSNGKTTTATLVNECLQKSGKTSFLGGNIGKALLPELEWLDKDDYVVAELSSFQLLTMCNLIKKPNITVITNIEATHLDHHSSLDEYVDSKRNLLIYQDIDSVSVLNSDCDYSIGHKVKHNMNYDIRGEKREFSISHKVINGAYMDKAGDIYYSDNIKKYYIMNKNDILIPGLHNIENYLAAICALWGIVEKEIFKDVAQTFSGVEHRIEFVRKVNGVSYYNDSIATSPSRVISCLKSFDEKIIMICGGSDKKNDFTIMIPYIINKVSLLILNGDTADTICSALREKDKENKVKIIKVKTLEEAVIKARENASEGDNVVLSPACPAFDQFKNFEKRGEKFKEMIWEF